MKKILVTKRRGIGDAVLMTPALEVLQKNFPEVEITVLVPKVVAPLFELQPGVARIWSFEDNPLPVWAFKIASERFDLVLDLNCTGQTRLLSRLSFAKKVISHRHDDATASRYATRPDGIEWDIHALTDYFPDLVIAPKDFLRPRIYFWEDEIAHAEEFWRSRGVVNGNVVVLGTSATRPTKRWPSKHYARFVELLKARLNMSVALLVGPGDSEREFANKVIHDINALHLSKDGGAFIVERVQNLRSFAALLASAYAYVGNDSGPKHIAVACGTPTLTFFGPEDPKEWHPYSRNDHPILYKPGLNCRKEDKGRWCSIHTCIVEKHRCMTSLSPEEAFNAFLAMERRPIIHERCVVKWKPPLPETNKKT